MRSINIGIGHDDDLMISELGNIEIVPIPDPKAVIIALISSHLQNFIQTRFFYIQNLSSKWKNRLVASVSGCLCRTSRRISLYDVNFAERDLYLQSASFPGSDMPSSAVFLLVKSLAFLAASLALCAHKIFQ